MKTTYQFRPNQRIWGKVNQAILGENAGEAIATIISGLSMLIINTGVCKTENEARVHLAAVLLSPDDSAQAGALLPMLRAELERLGMSVE